MNKKSSVLFAMLLSANIAYADINKVDKNYLFGHSKVETKVISEVETKNTEGKVIPIVVGVALTYAGYANAPAPGQATSSGILGIRSPSSFLRCCFF